MKHLQYFFIYQERGVESQKDDNKHVILTRLNVNNLIKHLSIENDIEIDIFIFNGVNNNNELECGQRIEDLCIQFDKYCIENDIDRRSIKLNVLYISQLQKETKPVSDTKIDDVFNYVHPFYASITKVFVKCDIFNIFNYIYKNIIDPLNNKVCAHIVKTLNMAENICGLYYTPTLEQSDSLKKL